MVREDGAEERSPTDEPAHALRCPRQGKGLAGLREVAQDHDGAAAERVIRRDGGIERRPGLRVGLRLDQPPVRLEALGAEIRHERGRGGAGGGQRLDQHLAPAQPRGRADPLQGGDIEPRDRVRSCVGDEFDDLPHRPFGGVGGRLGASLRELPDDGQWMVEGAEQGLAAEIAVEEDAEALTPRCNVGGGLHGDRLEGLDPLARRARHRPRSRQPWSIERSGSSPAGRGASWRDGCG